eukprot:Sdes_comp20298_c0_seq1m13912
MIHLFIFERYFLRMSARRLTRKQFYSQTMGILKQSEVETFTNFMKESPGKKRKNSTNPPEIFETEKKKMKEKQEENSEMKIKREENLASFQIKQEPQEIQPMKEELTEPEFSPSPPANWKKQIELLRQMRANKDAPVDSMGCASQPSEGMGEKENRLQILISLMLSSQTKDEVTFSAMSRLRNHGCSVKKLLETSQSEIEKIIYPVGFWRRKAQYLKKTVLLLHQNFNDDIPDSIPQLLSLPGVGPKMAYLCMNSAWHQNLGIGVDTHVHRIVSRLGWIHFDL